MLVELSVSEHGNGMRRRWSYNTEIGVAQRCFIINNGLWQYNIDVWSERAAQEAKKFKQAVHQQQRRHTVAYFGNRQFHAEQTPLHIE
jgi:hypothetical protein